MGGNGPRWRKMQTPSFLLQPLHSSRDCDGERASELRQRPFRSCKQLSSRCPPRAACRARARHQALAGASLSLTQPFGNPARRRQPAKPLGLLSRLSPRHAHQRVPGRGGGRDAVARGASLSPLCSCHRRPTPPRVAASVLQLNPWLTYPPSPIVIHACSRRCLPPSRRPPPHSSSRRTRRRRRTRSRPACCRRIARRRPRPRPPAPPRCAPA